MEKMCDRSSCSTDKQHPDKIRPQNDHVGRAREIKAHVVQALKSTYIVLKIISAARILQRLREQL
jgi:hypothetical protein